MSTNILVPEVQMLDSTIHWKNHYAKDKVLGKSIALQFLWIAIYPVDWAIFIYILKWGLEITCGIAFLVVCHSV